MTARGATPRAGPPLIAIASAYATVADDLEAKVSGGGFEVRRHPRLTQLLAGLQQIDLVLLHPKPEAGPATCVAIRQASRVPLIVIAVLSEQERVRYLDLGADFVLEWPVGTKELLARVKALLRRPNTPRPPRLLALGMGRVLDLDNRAMVVDGQPYALTPTEARLLSVLARCPGEPYSARALIEAVWGADYTNGQSKLLAATVTRIRRKLEVDPRDPRLLRFVRRQGWILGQAVHGATPAAGKTAAC